MKTLYFDEAGMTGNNLLDTEQPYFCYLGIEKFENIEGLFQQIKQTHGYNTNMEIKGSSLCKHEKGQNLIKSIWDAMGTHVKFVIHDKKYVLACKIFEYVYEPVFADWNMIFYNIDFHKYLASKMYRIFESKNETAEYIFKTFNGFIKSKEKGSLFERLMKEDHYDDMELEFFFKFCIAHKEEIASDIDFQDACDGWLLDLTLTSLYSLLGYFSGDTSESLKVYCDESKPLRTNESAWEGFINNEKIVYDELLNSHSRLTFNLSEKPVLSNSKIVIPIQIADLLASSVIYYMRNPDSEFSKKIKQNFLSALQRNSVLPSQINFCFDEIEEKYYSEILEVLSSPAGKEEKRRKIEFWGMKLKKYRECRCIPN